MIHALQSRNHATIHRKNRNGRIQHFAVQGIHESRPRPAGTIEMYLIFLGPALIRLTQLSDFDQPLHGLLFEEKGFGPRLVTVYAKQSARASKATDIFLCNVIGSNLRHDTTWIGEFDADRNVINKKHYVAFNSMNADRGWNEALKHVSRKSKLKGDVLILWYVEEEHRFRSMTSEDIEQMMMQLSALPLAFMFPSMKNSQ